MNSYSLAIRKPLVMMDSSRFRAILQRPTAALKRTIALYKDWSEQRREQARDPEYLNRRLDGLYERRSAVKMDLYDMLCMLLDPDPRAKSFESTTRYSRDGDVLRYNANAFNHVDATYRQEGK